MVIAYPADGVDAAEQRQQLGGAARYDAAEPARPEQSALGRRGFMAGIAAAAVAGAVIARPDPAQASDDYTPQPYLATETPDAEELHVIRRWTYGYRPEQLAALRAAGGARAWFEAQLEPDGVPESQAGSEVDGWWECLSATPEQIVERDRDKVEAGWEAMNHYARFALLKRMESERQVLELMTEFWEDHLYIPVQDDAVHPFRIDFGHGIRERALSSFEELLQYSTVHPAMSCSLDAAGSTRNALNENLGRELLELHTVGQDAYTEDDVKDSARLLTGYRVETWRSWRVYYSPDDHYVGPVRILDFTHANGAADGRPAVEAYLSYLARHPATAHRIARKLAQRFVSDEPSQQLVDALASSYLQHGTEVKPMLRALFEHPEFWSSSGAKVKTPTDEVVSMYRALGVGFEQPSASGDGAMQILWISRAIGSTPWSHPRPDGPPSTNDAWTSPSRFLGSWQTHWNAANGYWPRDKTRYRDRADWLPESGITMGRFVDHLCRTITGEGSTPELLEACSVATKTGPTTAVTAGHALLGWKLGMLLATVSNQPTFYLR